MQRNRRLSVALVGLVALLAFFLGGCFRIRQEVTLKPEEAWEASLEITIPASTVSMLSQQGGVEDFGKNLEAQWKNQEQQFQVQGITAKVTSTKTDQGDYVLGVSTVGKGWDLLNRAAFTSTAKIEVLQNGHISLYYDPNKGSVASAGQAGNMDMSAFYGVGGAYTFVLRTGAIYSSNANKVDGGTAIWENPTGPITAEVGLTGAPGMQLWLIIVLVAGGVLLVAAVVVLFLLRWRPKRL